MEEVKCDCGIKLQKSSLKAHLKTKLHYDRINNIPKQIPFKDAMCTCECGMRLKKVSLWNHMKTHKHNDLLQNIHKPVVYKQIQNGKLQEYMISLE